MTEAINANSALTPRWTKLFYHPEQNRLWNSTTRFKVAHAGRRAGKTELAKRKIVIEAMRCDKPQGRFIAAAPTWRQSVDIWWDDILALVPPWALLNGKRSVSLSFRKITLWNNATISVVGLDKPERVEGSALDFFVGDEFGNCKSTVWDQNIRPALSTIGRPGQAWLIGTPEGRNHYYQICQDALKRDDWDSFSWCTAEINPEEAEAARGELDELTYSQEYGGEFVNFSGRAYYTFDDNLNCPPDKERVLYNESYPLCFSFDFNRVPGTAVISQELPAPEWLIKRNQGKNKGTITSVIDEVFLQKGSTTEKVCNELLQRWRHHKGLVKLYADATGGAHTSSGVAGSDLDIINAKLDGPFNVEENWPKSNPPIRVRINTVNSRVCSAAGYIGTIVDRKCKYLIRDLEGVSCDDEGGILKSDTKSLLTHISDALGYFMCVEHPLGGGAAWSNRGF
jgi:hypothetical protein